MTHMVDMRCPLDRRRLFGKLRVKDGFAVTSENLLEFACAPCRKRTGAIQVLHRFDFSGRHVETIVAKNHD
jgi:hypothetical protein